MPNKFALTPKEAEKNCLMKIIRKIRGKNKILEWENSAEKQVEWTGWLFP